MLWEYLSLPSDVELQWSGPALCCQRGYIPSGGDWQDCFMINELILVWYHTLSKGSSSTTWLNFSKVWPGIPLSPVLNPQLPFYSPHFFPSKLGGFRFLFFYGHPLTPPRSDTDALNNQLVWPRIQRNHTQTGNIHGHMSRSIAIPNNRCAWPTITMLLDPHDYSPSRVIIP